MLCEKCGNQLTKGMKFCNLCGTEIHWSEPKPENHPAKGAAWMPQIVTNVLYQEEAQKTAAESPEMPKIMTAEANKKAWLRTGAAALLCFAAMFAIGYFFKGTQFDTEQVQAEQIAGEAEAHNQVAYQDLQREVAAEKKLQKEIEQKKQAEEEKRNPKLPIAVDKLELFWLPPELEQKYDWVGTYVLDDAILVGERIDTRDEEYSPIEKGTSIVDCILFPPMERSGAFGEAEFYNFGLINIRGIEIFPPIYRGAIYTFHGARWEDNYEHGDEPNDALEMDEQSGQYHFLVKEEKGERFTDRQEAIDGNLTDEEWKKQLTELHREYFPQIYPVLGTWTGYGVAIARVRDTVSEGLLLFSDKQADHLFAEKGGKIGFVNTEGQVVIPPIFDRAETFQNGYAYVEMGEKKGFLKNPLPMEQRRWSR